MSNSFAAHPVNSAKKAAPDLIKVTDAIRTLLAAYPDDDQKAILAALTETAQQSRIPAPKAGSVLGAIIRLIPKTRSWTVEDLKQNVSENRVEASPKEIYNAVGYLTRKGHIRRISYGRYAIHGVMVETSDDFGGELSKNEGEPDQ